MPRRSIQIKTLGTATGGYRVLASWKPLKKSARKKLVDVWIPMLAPSHALGRQCQCGEIEWSEFASRYLRELHTPSSQDILKPLALLSFRRPIVLLCDCPDHLRCPTAVLARALEECRRNGNFILSPLEKFPVPKTKRRNQP
ncbi:MAG: DUF488 family protein [Elusimicrobia bacterium]|nr:DUF488 family protein [Elusimicrobiota bacterium]